MTAIDDAIAIVSSAGLSIDKVYGNNLPQEVADSLDKTVVLVTDAGNSPDGYGNGDFWRLYQEVEVQIWYSQEFGGDPETLEVALMKAFVHAGWQVAAVRQRTLDPDTQQLMNTFYFSRKKNIGGN
ncbi:DUF806 family protein [Lacticaseibacillus mingshuiensis]|uniref:DUF806 family protein n=1 Tax=Lacticaseibacillus mingshuiensis TaxID=2799574 RepID=A0ABW4CF39_9LACO|nr:DUF806 family protein [Lacticaseibacillus mingshuiensis]